MIYFSDLEDKLLRIWIKYLINRLNANERSSNESTSNIQRIAKKSRTSASTNFIHEKQRNTAPLPVYPFIFNPFIHHTYYSTFVPFSHGATTHLIPISQVPYQQEEYHHQILIPIQTQYPYGFSHVPGYMSSTPVYMNTNIKKPVNFHSYITPNNQGEIRKYDKHEEAPASITKININNTTPMGLPLEEPVQINPTKDEDTEQLNPSKGEESMNSVKNLPKPGIMQNNQTKKFQDTQYLPSSTTGEELDTSTPPDKTIFQEYYSTTLMPMDKSDLSSQQQIFNSKSSIQLIPSKNSNYEMVKSNTINQSFSKLSTQEINTWPITENPKESTTESETEPENTNYSDTKETSIVEERNQSGDPRQVPVDDLSLKDKNKTKNISEASTIRTEEKSLQTVKSEESKILIVSSTSAYPKPTLLPTTLYDDKDGQKSKSSFNVTESIKTVVQITSNDSSIQSKSEFSTTQSTRAYDDNYNQSVLNSSTVSQISDTKISEPTTLTNTISKSLIFEVTTTSPFSLGSISSKLSQFENPSNKNSSIQPTSLPYSNLIPAIPPLTFNNTVTSVLTVPKSEVSPFVIKNSSDYSTENLKDMQLSYDKSTILPETTVTTPSRRESIENTIQNNKSPSVKIMTPKISSSRTTTEIPNILHREDKMNHNFSATAKETRKNWLTSKTTVKPRISIQKPLPSVTVSDSLKRKSMNNQDRIIAKTEPTQTYDDSQLWYNNQMNTENIPKKELNEAQIDFLLKKLIKLLKPEIEKQTLTKDSIARLIAPKLEDQDKLVYIIFPWVRDAVNNMENEENTKVNKNPLKHSEKL